MWLTRVDVSFDVTDCNGNAASTLTCVDAVKVEDNTPPMWSGYSVHGYWNDNGSCGREL